ncbi:MAG: S-layer homology domain-containing protein [Oscillospiraceae bacterium]|jgi:hypothetical protein|nr:S-layer homology domain-containing protein [Oscillospiraceae bacterium]
MGKKMGAGAVRAVVNSAIAAICALAAALSVPVWAIAEEAAGFVITVGSAEAAPGGYADITVSFEGNPGIAAFALGLRYDAAKLEPVSFVSGAALDVGVMTSNIQAEGGAKDGYVSAVWVNASDCAGDGAAFTVRFKVPAGAGGVIPISAEIDPDGIVNQKFEEVGAKAIGGAVTVIARDGTSTAGETPPAGGTDVAEEEEEEAWYNPFDDVRSGDWFYGAAEYVCASGLMRGVSESEFAPGLPVSRAMLVTVLHRAAGEPAIAFVGKFVDVPDGAWYTDAILWASANGIVQGYGNGVFGTNDAMTREQVATALYRRSGSPVNGLSDSLTKYADAAQISDWALDAMKWANATGLMTGRSETELAPKGTLTRAEAAAILQRMTV